MQLSLILGFHAVSAGGATVVDVVVVVLLLVVVTLQSTVDHTQ